MLKVVGAWLQTKISFYILSVLGVLAILAPFVGQIERSGLHLRGHPGRSSDLAPDPRSYREHDQSRMRRKEKQCGAVECSRKVFYHLEARAAEKSNMIHFGIIDQRKLNISLAETPLALAGLSTAFLRSSIEPPKVGRFDKTFVAHNAVGRYSSMTRILKRYKFNYHVTETGTPHWPAELHRVSRFGDQPGQFYVLRGHNHQMAVTGTTLNNYNPGCGRFAGGPRVTSQPAREQRQRVGSHAGSLQFRYRFDRRRHYARHRQRQLRALFGRSITCPQRRAAHGDAPGVRRSRGRRLAWLVEQLPGLALSPDISDACPRTILLGC
ncbi:hypothetical protein EVAR_101087_1 [Eumeta japonica]|uniref:Uncharacterized protein n=1 Tax=Eumeta variegata TaxID=151549 RepID=A0A4C2AAC9_EUMVA|nr:hypothetical protein EVAR_101087_1 [Eumeta japonica]